MQRLSKIVLLGAGTVGLAIGGYGIAAASANPDSAPTQSDVDGPTEANDSDAPLVGADLDRAVEAALEHTGGGEVTETEEGDDGAAFGVEIRLDDGRQVEVNLDANFVVIGSEADED